MIQPKSFKKKKALKLNKFKINFKSESPHCTLNNSQFALSASHISNRKGYLPNLENKQSHFIFVLPNPKKKIFCSQIAKIHLNKEMNSESHFTDRELFKSHKSGQNILSEEKPFQNSIFVKDEKTLSGNIQTHKKFLFNSSESRESSNYFLDNNEDKRSRPCPSSKHSESSSVACDSISNFSVKIKRQNGRKKVKEESEKSDKNSKIILEPLDPNPTVNLTRKSKKFELNFQNQENQRISEERWDQMKKISDPPLNDSFIPTKIKDYKPQGFANEKMKTQKYIHTPNCETTQLFFFESPPLNLSTKRRQNLNSWLLKLKTLTPQKILKSLNFERNYKILILNLYGNVGSQNIENHLLKIRSLLEKRIKKDIFEILNEHDLNHKSAIKMIGYFFNLHLDIPIELEEFIQPIQKLKIIFLILAKIFDSKKISNLNMTQTQLEFSKFYDQEEKNNLKNQSLKKKLESKIIFQDQNISISNRNSNKKKLANQNPHLFAQKMGSVLKALLEKFSNFKKITKFKQHYFETDSQNEIIQNHFCAFQNLKNFFENDDQDFSSMIEVFIETQLNHIQEIFLLYQQYFIEKNKKFYIYIHESEKNEITSFNLKKSILNKFLAKRKIKVDKYYNFVCKIFLDLYNLPK